MIIYEQYNQEELDNQYNNRLHVPDFATYLQQWDDWSETARQQYPYLRDLKYGDHPGECLDIFPSEVKDAKVLVFIHGGYWQLFDKTTFHFIAAALLPHHVTTVIINYPLAPAATMDQIVAACCNAMRWLQLHLTSFTAGSQQVYVAGHSAGAHLATMLMSKEWNTGMQPFIKGMCLLSGLYNLVPIQLSYVNAALQMDKETAVRNSPVNLPVIQPCPLLVATGSEETAAFKSQSSALYNCRRNTVPVELVDVPGYNHFSILNALVDENTLLHKTMMTMMNG